MKAYNDSLISLKQYNYLLRSPDTGWQLAEEGREIRDREQDPSDFF